jgi:uncharacterized SAM-binding protein YcdF (DUF218 family)
MRREPFLGLEGAFAALLSLLVMAASLGISLLLAMRQVRRIAMAAPVTAPPAGRALVLGRRLDAPEPGPDYGARLRRAARLAAADPGLVLVVLGGVTRAGLPSEAAAGRMMLARLGIAPARILTEDTSRHTLENLRAFRAHFGPGTLPDLLVTSRVHLARSLRMAQGLGLVLLPCAAEDAARVTPLGVLREAIFLHWYRVGEAYAMATANQAMLRRIR